MRGSLSFQTPLQILVREGRQLRLECHQGACLGLVASGRCSCGRWRPLRGLEVSDWRPEGAVSLFGGAVKGVVIQQVEVLPEELTVHLGSYGAGAGGNRRA